MVSMGLIVSPAELHALLARDPAIRLLDVRTPAEYETVHISGAYNVPLDALVEHGPEIRAHVDAPVVLVCQSGQRSRQAETALRESGVASLHVLDGGVNAWIAAGLPVRRGAQRLSMERQVRLAAGSLAVAGGLLAVVLHPLFGLVAAFIGGGLVRSGLTGSCDMATLLGKLPYNRRATCDVRAMVAALKAGMPPATAREGA
jgi:rhodanese-related sulfurtransferase